MITPPLHPQLQESGQKDVLKELLRKRLFECGWHDDLKAHCKEVIKNKGMEKIEVDDLVREITPHGRGMVPESVKAELLSKIQQFIASTASTNA
jgi:enhancer of yellow 2 transcription factor|eukprot:SAG25_NODE_1959_length_2095_cov_7.030060_1_plen_94_part_00